MCIRDRYPGSYAMVLVQSPAPGAIRVGERTTLKYETVYSSLYGWGFRTTDFQMLYRTSAKRLNLASSRVPKVPVC
eukprot:1978754-Rhodomonas_salina.2